MQPFSPFDLARGTVATSAFLAFSGCANAQPANPPAAPKAPNSGAFIFPLPEAPTGEPVVVAPAPFEKTVWRAGSSGVLKLSGPLQGFAGKLQIRDFDGKIVRELSVNAGAKSVILPVSTPGLYSVQAGDKTYSFSVVPTPKPRAAQVPNRTLIGLNTHFGPRDAPDEPFIILREGGVDAVRDEMGWGSMEKTPGVFNFIPRHVKYNAQLKKYGIPLHFSASYGNPLYPQVVRYPAAEAAAPYARYVVEVLKKFGDNIIAVEIINEPNRMPPLKDYAPVLRETLRAVRAAGFKQTVVGIGGAGAGGGMTPNYARTVFDSGVIPDAFSIHPYMAPFPPDTGYAPANGVANLDAALTRAGNVVRDFKLQGSYITELGWSGIERGQNPTVENYATPNSARTMVSEPKQAAFTARTLLGASKYPHLKAIYLYDFMDDGPIVMRREHRFGLVRQDLQPKMAWQAFAVARDFLSDKTFVKRFQKPDSYVSANLYRDRAGEHYLAAWTTELRPEEVEAVVAAKKTDPQAPLPPRHMENEWHAALRLSGFSNLQGFDWQGASLPKSAQITLTSLPTYLKVGRDANRVALQIGVVKQIKAGADGYPTAEIEAAIAARDAEAAAKAAAPAAP